MARNSYRLGDYKITESGTDDVRWEAHYGFGALQEGRCFRKGAILFIGPAENEQVGFLKGDFLDYIKAFPVWSKTRYYCSAVDLCHCDTGKRVDKQEMLMWMLGRGRDDERKTPKEGIFRLGRYEITRKGTGQIAWRTALGANTMSQGACTLLEDILFMGPGETMELDPVGHRFSEDLRQLSAWDQTTYFCPNASLLDCRSWNRATQPTKTRPRFRRTTAKPDDAEKVGRSIRFKPAGSGTWKRQAVVFSHRAMKCVICAAKGLGRILSFSCSCSIRWGREMEKLRRLKKEKRSIHLL